MESILAITESDIEARVGAQSFERGQDYAAEGAIFSARRQGMTLKANCTGSYNNSYRLHVTFDASGIAEANCSCPVGDGGYCKHIAALLLTWIESPDLFTAQEETGAALEQRGKDELIALIKQMLRRHPDLEVLLETPLPVAGQRARPVNPEVYRRQAAAAFRHGDYEWGMEAGMADELSSIVEIGDGFAMQDDYASATTVYEAVSTEVLQHYGEYGDENGDLGGVIQECVQGLGRCLAAETEGEARAAILRALFAIYRFDVDSGGAGWSDGVPDLLLNHTSPAERRAIAGWVRDAMPQGTDWTANYNRRVYGAFLLDLEADDLDDDAYLAICRETGRTGDLVDRLLEMERVDDAIAAAEESDDHTLLPLADLFVGRGYYNAAERLMLQRSSKTQDVRILTWLKDRYKSRDNTAAALDLARRIFRAQPSVEGYTEIRELAEPRGRWESLRPTLRMFLQQSKRDDLLIPIYLADGEIDHALEAVKARPTPQHYFHYYGDNIALTVARAAEAVRPRASIEIYQQQAERMIAARGRQNYQAACRLLKKVRDHYHGLGEDDTGTAYVADLRERNSKLRALKEEMAAAGL